jgi:transposase
MKRVPAALLEVDLDDLLSIIEKPTLSEQDRTTLRAVAEAYALLTRELEAKRTSITRLRKILFGAGTEKTCALHGTPGSAGAGCGDGRTGAGGTGAQEGKPKRKGHGRNGAARYPGAERVHVPHPSLRPGDPCPACQHGKLYALRVPAVQVRVRGQAPMAARLYEHARLRCSPCGEIFEAPALEGEGDEKYDETVPAMIGVLRFSSGTPHTRVDRLQGFVGVPLPASTQWELIHRAVNVALGAACNQLIREAAQGKVVHNDDTTAKILQLMGKRRQQKASTGEASKRTGIFTTGIVSVCEGRRIALFFTGPQHAGENLRDLLAQRSTELSAPIQMCDALSRNLPKALKTILSNCLAHGRRQFVEIYDRFPDECLHVLEALREVYRNDEIAREQTMSDKERLAWHKAKSGSVMKDLKRWLKAQLSEKKVEPNSCLGEAIGYMLKHWHALTQFLRVAGAPLDNNICERALKKAILHRRNSLFYKTLNGARVGDVFMSLIYTAELCGANPFDYLVALLRHAAEVHATPTEWMPWNYVETRARLAAAA